MTDPDSPASPAHNSSRFLRSGEVAAAVGINVQQTLRYYERRGVLAQAEGTPPATGGTRPGPSRCCG